MLFYTFWIFFFFMVLLTFMYYDLQNFAVSGWLWYNTTINFLWNLTVFSRHSALSCTRSISYMHAESLDFRYVVVIAVCGIFTGLYLIGRFVDCISNVF